MNKPQRFFQYSAIGLAISSVFSTPSVALAQNSSDNQIETIEITATRRSGTVQDAPLNITALTPDTLAEQNIADLEDVARWVPGLTVIDQGGRNTSPIVVRGLNTNNLGPGPEGGTVATYVGEIPLLVNMRLNDIERVEVLIGPQGTLYGAGTLGGAIRYISKQVELDLTEGQISGDLFSLSQSDSLGGEGGFVFNTPLINDELGIRVSLNKLHNPGFIDYNYLVKESGVSLADPDWSNPAEVEQNIYQKKDLNSEDTLTTKMALRWMPNENLDATLSYFYQKQEFGARSIVHNDALAVNNPLSELVGEYESAYRYEEPREVEDSLLSLEIKADLGFADLVSATGKSEHEGDGSRDQSDLLIGLGFGYEEFPAFSSYSRDTEQADIFTQEVRLVSTNDSALSWIAGAYYYKVDSSEISEEFTPGFDEFALNDWQTGGNLRPDSLEYYSVTYIQSTEKALFGELSYQFSAKFDVTLGVRFYQYDVAVQSAVDFPLLYTSIDIEDGADDFRSGDEILFDLVDVADEDEGSLLKLNASYQFSDDVLAYATISEGFRIGGANSVGACDPNAANDAQQVCALPFEQTYAADTTVNYELGFKSAWLRNKFHFNGALFNVDWKDAQVAGSTQNGLQPITRNAGTANAKGIEISTRAIMTDALTAYATYAFTQAELTKDVLGLFGNGDGDGAADNDGDIDALSGDRLPGSAEHQLSFGIKYSTEVWDGKSLDIVYGLTSQSDVITQIGNRESGESLGGYSLSNISASIAENSWTATFYVSNLFDKYAYTSARTNKGNIGLATAPDVNTNGFEISRSYGHYLATPRKVGVKFSYDFEL
ncbi:TonB-dependent receptor [Paraglaciecola sp. L3A3]|uniref:TonB-dependent receptor n=1 Tax=Paraglaciecola sp. L3A3 TaxID=2686358 RepID=UPI00131BD0BB|nr:TonB-dependent receptor [Paraglaciecola sp. L3A3]